MYKTEQEIHEQHVALQQTKAWFAQNRSSLAAFFAANPAQRFVMLGSGSGYMLAKSAAAAFSRAVSTMFSLKSSPYTSYPALCRASESRPVPQPASSTRAPAGTPAACSRRA